MSDSSSLNPKDIHGLRKVSLSKIPVAALIHEAGAFKDGADKYGPFNWRTKKVLATIYIDACLRHVWKWFDGEECDSDNGVHHLGCARAGLGILLDALENDCLVDDRPVPGRASEIFKEHERAMTQVARVKEIVEDNREVFEAAVKGNQAAKDAGIEWPPDKEVKLCYRRFQRQGGGIFHVCNMATGHSGNCGLWAVPGKMASS